MTTMSMSAQLKKRFDTANLNRGIELVDEGKLDEGLKCFEAELKEHPKNPYAHFYMATVYMDKKQYDYAMTAIDKALMYMPKKHKELRGITCSESMLTRVFQRVGRGHQATDIMLEGITR